MNSLEKIHAHVTGHLMGNSEHDRPDVPILTLQESKIEPWLEDVTKHAPVVVPVFGAALIFMLAFIAVTMA